MSEALSVYVHVPFCVSKCGYCDFLSFAGAQKQWAGYVVALCREIREKSALYGARSVGTVFFGGGTPTVLPVDALAAILDTVRQCFDLEDGAEITAEANPETVGFAGLCALRQGGFNRISFGVQSFDDAELRTLGRAHDAAKALRGVGTARAAEFGNVSLDLMFALPGQTAESWARTLAQAVALRPAHVSCYALTVEEGTAFARGGARPLDDEADRAMYHYAQDFLAENGYAQYEISNFAKAGFECRHNLVYWTGVDYVGFGLGAHSFAGGARYRNTENLADYIGGDFAAYDTVRLTREDAMAEFLFLGLRVTRGVEAARFAETFGFELSAVYGEAIERHVRGGLLAWDGGRLFLTRAGMDLSNRVFTDFLI